MKMLPKLSNLVAKTVKDEIKGHPLYHIIISGINDPYYKKSNVRKYVTNRFGKYTRIEPFSPKIFKNLIIESMGKKFFNANSK